MVAAATGTPSWALASMAYDAGWRRAIAARWASAAPTPRQTPSTIIDGWSTRSRSCSAAPSQTKNSGPKKPSVTANSCLATRRGSPTAATARPGDEAGEHQRDVHGDRERRHREHRGEAHPELDCELPVLRDVVHPACGGRCARPARAGPGRGRRRPCTTASRSERRSRDVVGVDDQRQQHDAQRVGDRRPGEAGRRRRGRSAPSESTVGSTMAAEDDAISTAYTRAWEVPTSGATAYPRTRAATPTSGSAGRPVRSAVRRRGSRTGTWVPATNITSTNPQLPRKENVGSLASSTPNPVAPRTTPASSSPRTTGRRQRLGVARIGPASATAHTIARSRNDTSGC